MESSNINDLLRSKISNKLQDDTNSNVINIFYEEIKNDVKVSKIVIEVMYLTSLYVNSFLSQKYLNEEEFNLNLSKLLQYKSVDEFINKLDYNTFKMLCNDTLYFNSSSYYAKKKFILSTKNCYNDILSISNNYLNDVVFYVKPFTNKNIINKYNLEYNKTNNSLKAVNDTIKYVISLLKELELEDTDNYKLLVNDIISTYYTYGRYMLLNNKKLSFQNIKILENIDENWINSFEMFDNESLKYIIKNYLSFLMLDDDKKMKISDFMNKKDNKYSTCFDDIDNPNTKIRKFLKSLFNDVDYYNENKLLKNIDNIKILKNSDLFDLIVEVLYTDAIYSEFMNNLGYLCTRIVNIEYEYIKNMHSIKEFKNYLYENDLTMLRFIKNSIEFDDAYLMDKKDILGCVDKKSFELSNIYLFDKISYAKPFDMNEVHSIYKKNLDSFKDKNLVIIRSASDLSIDLLDLSYYDSKNYKDMFYKVLEIYYKYNKYLISINEVISLENELLLKKIEENLNAFFNAKNIDDILYILCLDFYKYLYSSNLDKDKIDIYYENMKKRGKVKLFSNKKRGSNP